MERRTKANFDKHEHRVEIFKSGEGNEIRVDHFQVEKLNHQYIRFVNTDRTMTVTGDYGNWVFCRPFHPSSDGHVSDGYWLEKLHILSEQVAQKYDVNETRKRLKELIDSDLEEWGYEGDELKQHQEQFRGLMAYTDDEIEYTYHAFRTGSVDYDMIPFEKSIHPWLLVIFDAFDEICRRLK